MSRYPVKQEMYEPFRVLVYSDDAQTRGRVLQIIGHSPDSSIPTVDFIETATHDAVLARMTTGGVDLAILDAEASPVGGLGIARQLRDELVRCPPIVVLIGRAEDVWLAHWSSADDVVLHPLDPIALTQTVVPLLRGRFVA